MVNAVIYRTPLSSSCEHTLHRLAAVGRKISSWAKQAANSVSRWFGPIMRLHARWLWTRHCRKANVTFSGIYSCFWHSQSGDPTFSEKWNWWGLLWPNGPQGPFLISTLQSASYPAHFSANELVYEQTIRVYGLVINRSEWFIVFINWFITLLCCLAHKV